MQTPWALQAADSRGAKKRNRGMTPVQWLSIKQTGVRHLHTIQSAIMRGNRHMSSHDYGAVLKVKLSCLLCHTPCVHGAEQTYLR